MPLGVPITFFMCSKFNYKYLFNDAYKWFLKAHFNLTNHTFFIPNMRNKVLVILCCSALYMLLSACSPKIHEKGSASFYADSFQGKRTANGERFNQKKKSAAHKTLPFGTKVKVTNLKNGKSVKVRINDRGPFVAGRIIDLSKRAAQKIDMKKDGVVSVEIVYKKPKK
jgi:rare lipoprotein A